MNRTQAITGIITSIGGIKRSLHSQTYHCQDGSSLTTSQLILLFVIKQQGPLSAGELADKLSLTPGAVSQIVDSLLESKFITRTPQANSRRTFDLNLSKNGAKKLATIEQERYTMIERATVDLTDDELEIFVTSLQKILKAVQPNKEVKQ